MQTLKFKLNPSGRKRRELLEMMNLQTDMINTILAKLQVEELMGNLTKATAFDIQKRFACKKSLEYIGNGFKQGFAESAAIKAAQGWQSYVALNSPIDKETSNPKSIFINEPMMYLRTRQAKFLKTERGNFILAIVRPKGKLGEKIIIPTDGHQYDGIIEEIVNKTGRWSEKCANEFTAEIKVSNDELYLHVMCDFPQPEVDYEAETIVGVDAGIVNTAVLAVIGKDSNLKGAKFFNGRKVKHLVKKLDKRNDGLKSNGKELVSVSDFKRTVSHQVSRAIIEFAKTHPKPAIVVEDLKHIPRGKFYRRMNRMLDRWDYRRFLGMLEYKCANEGIKFVKVYPRGTSSTCPKCGGTVERRRRIHEAACVNCKYTLNDDLLGAYNTALRGYVALQDAYKHPRKIQAQTLTSAGHASLGEVSSNTSGCSNALHPDGLRNETISSQPRLAGMVD